ncbi:MAG: sigma-70 family RNA polymerase sigma factor [Thermoleophilaceae bacterium]
MGHRGRVPHQADSSSSDETLVAQAQSGNRDAFEELVRRHADRLFAVLLRFNGNRADAEEASQEAFLRAWRSIGRFEGRAKFFTWVYRIAINEAKRIGECRPPADRVVSSQEDPVEHVADNRAGGPEHAERAELFAVLERAIEALPEDYRLPLVLRDIEGLSTTEAADVLDLGEAALKSRLHRARMIVRKAVEGYLDEEDV